VTQGRLYSFFSSAHTLRAATVMGDQRIRMAVPHPALTLASLPKQKISIKNK